MPRTRSLAQRVSRYRKAKGWTQADMAREFGWTVGTQSSYERGTIPKPGLYRDNLYAALEKFENKPQAAAS